jgi:MFS family permease
VSGFSSQIGLYSGILQGMIYDKYGVRVACVVAMVCLCGGYLAVFFASLHNPSPILLAIVFFLIGQGSHGYYTVR